MWMTRVSINNPVFATMVMVALCVLGLFSYQRLAVEQMPDISPPVVFISVIYPGVQGTPGISPGAVLISVIYPGASPGAVETEITKPLENAPSAIAGALLI